MTGEEIDEQLAAVREQQKVLVPVDEQRPVGDGEVAEVTLTLQARGRDDHRREGLLVGLPGDQLHEYLKPLVRGLEPGKKRTAQLTVPEQYMLDDWANESAEATVELTGIQRLELPEIDDALATKLGHQTADELRQSIRMALLQAKEQRRLARAHRQLIEQIVKRHPFEVPRALIQRRAETIVSAISADMFPNMGQDNRPSLDDFESEKRTDVLAEADFSVRRERVLTAVARQEQLTVSEEDRQERIAAIAQQTDQPPETIRAYLKDSGEMASLDARIFEDKAMALLLARAARTAR